MPYLYYGLYYPLFSIIVLYHQASLKYFYPNSAIYHIPILRTYTTDITTANGLHPSIINSLSCRHLFSFNFNSFITILSIHIHSILLYTCTGLLYSTISAFTQLKIPAYRYHHHHSYNSTTVTATTTTTLLNTACLCLPLPALSLILPDCHILSCHLIWSPKIPYKMTAPPPHIPQNPSDYGFPELRLKPKMDDPEKTPLLLVACGSFSPITYLHLRMFEMAADYVKFSTDFEMIGGVLSPVSDAYRKAGLANAEDRYSPFFLFTWFVVGADNVESPCANSPSIRPPTG